MLFMSFTRLSLILASLLFTNACAAVTLAPDQSEKNSENLKEPALVQVLPDSVQSFERRGYKYFNDGSGYSIRYANERKQRMADLYIYQVADENASLDHEQLVIGSTRATMDAISDAAQNGHYANFNVVDAVTHSQGMRTIARVQATYLRQNLASYTLVYQTEHKGTLLKVRVTMPDNDSNRNSDEWDRFTDTVFKAVIDDIDRPELAAASEQTSDL